MQKCSRVFIFFLVALSFFITMSTSAFSIVKIAVSPFSIQAPPDLNYLKKGLRNLFVSRLSVPGKIQAVALDKAVSLPVPLGESINQEQGLALNNITRADYLLVGNITAIGQMVNIDSWLYNLDTGKEPKKFSAQATDLNNVVQQVNQMATSIVISLGVKDGQEKAIAENVNPQAASTNNQAKPSALDVLVNPLLQQQNISYLNPNFIEITPEDILKNMGVWRSQTIPDGLVGMDIGDVDGDGKTEIVTVSYKKLSIFQRQGAGLRLLGSYQARRMDRFIWCCLIDLDGDDREEIVVTNMRLKNVTQGGFENSMDRADTEFSEPSSMIFRWTNHKIQLVKKNLPYFLNVIMLEGNKLLIGQKQAPNRGFGKEIYEMTYKNGNLEPMRVLNAPKYCNVFNFAIADVDSNGSNEYIVILPNNKLAIFDSNGTKMWKSRHRFGATTNYVIGKIDDARFNVRDYYYLPTPILVTDLNDDGTVELVVNRSPEYSRFLPSGFKYYESGQIVSLSWDQIGLIENWATREISGMVTSIRIGDTDNNDIPELIVSVILSKDLLKLWKSKSVIFSYDLNLKGKNTK